MKHAKSLFLAGVIIVLVGGGLMAFAAARSPIHPASYEPPPAPTLAGPTAPNRELRSIERLGDGGVRGPEDVDVDTEGRIYAGTADGRIVRLTLDAGNGERLEAFADTGGRPLGLDFDPAGNLVVADAVSGLLSVDPEGEIIPLATEAGGEAFGFTDDVDVATDGSVYFSDASSAFGVHEYLYDLLEARPHGRLLRYDPASAQTEVLLEGLYFANGVALSQAEDFVLVNETYRYRITRYWLQGPRAGTWDLFADNLPGFPDGVSANGHGTFWVALYTVRNRILDGLHPRPWAKTVLSGLPRALWPKPEPYGLVLALDEEGRIVRSLHDPTGEAMKEVTSVEERGGHLYLGSLDGRFIGRYALTP